MGLNRFEREPIVLESSLIRVTFSRKGGRIRSLVSKRTGREYFYQDPREEFVESGFADNDISGFLECFPTVGQSRYPDGRLAGLDLGDHGLLWGTDWDCLSTDGVVELRTEAPDVMCEFRRTATLESDACLRLNYTIVNNGPEAFRYIYSAHPILYGNEHTRFKYPPEMNKACVCLAVNVPGVSGGEWIDFPAPDSTTLNGAYLVERESAVKLFSPRLSVGRASVCHTDIGESLEIEFDTETLHHLGVLISQGFYGPYEGLKGTMYFGLEPTTGIGDDFVTCSSNGTLATISSSGAVGFWIKLRLIDG